MKPCGPSRRRVRNASTVLRFRSSPKKDFFNYWRKAVIPAQTLHFELSVGQVLLAVKFAVSDATCACIRTVRSGFHSVEIGKLNPPVETRGAGVDVTRTRNSLIPKKCSLFPEIFSLLICIGNFTKSRCSAAISLSVLGSRSLKIAKFPVKLPISRE